MSSFDIVVVDSVAALVPRAELEGDMGDTHVGLQARLMSQALRTRAWLGSQSPVPRWPTFCAHSVSRMMCRQD